MLFGGLSFIIQEEINHSSSSVGLIDRCTDRNVEHVAGYLIVIAASDHQFARKGKGQSLRSWLYNGRYGSGLADDETLRDVLKSDGITLSISAPRRTGTLWTTDASARDFCANNDNPFPADNDTSWRANLTSGLSGARKDTLHEREYISMDSGDVVWRLQTWTGWVQVWVRLTCETKRRHTSKASISNICISVWTPLGHSFVFKGRPI